MDGNRLSLGGESFGDPHDFEMGPESDAATAPVTPADPNLSSFLLDVVFNRRAKNTTGQVLPNNVAAPADGSAQTAYDTFLGTTSSSNETIDPIFATAANGEPAMIVGDGNDTLQISAALATARLKSLGNGGPWSYIGLFKAPAAHGSAEIFLQSGGNTSTVPGLSLRYSGTAVRNATADGTTANSFNFPATPLPTTGYYLLVATYNPATRDAKCYVNKASGPPTGNNAAGFAVVSTQGSIAFGAHGAGAGFIEDALINHVMTDVEVAAVRDFYEAKYSIEIFN